MSFPAVDPDASDDGASGDGLEADIDGDDAADDHDDVDISAA
jgi:hypothetical protein